MQKMKICNKCDISKLLNCFYKANRCKDGHRNSCKECVKKRIKNYKLKNKTKIKEYSVKYYNKNKESIKTKIKEYRKENKEKRNKHELKRISSDINYKIAVNLRKRLYNAIKGQYKTGSAVKDLGCDIPFLKKYIESQFKKDMSWENWSINGWHMDHIVPLSSFDLTKREEFLEACHYTNLQPLWAKENLTKYNKIGE